MDKRAELDAVAAALTSGGVAAWIDPRDVTPPAAWVHLGPWSYDLLSGECVSGQLIIDLIAPDQGTYAALATLDDLETGTVVALGPPVGPVFATTLTLPDSSTVLPCYRLLYDVVLS